MVPNSVYEKALHSKAVLSLYKELLRGAGKLRDVSSHSSAEIAKFGPIVVAKEPYFKNLSYQLKISINEEFRKPTRHVASLGVKIVKGVEFVTCLYDFLHDNRQFEPFAQLLQAYKQEAEKKQDARAEYLTNMKNGDVKPVKGKFQPRKPTEPITIFHKLSSQQRRKVLREEVEKSAFHSSHLLRRYFALQQSRFMIPLPQKLPYTGPLPRIKASELGNASYGSKRSENAGDIYRSYDEDYVDAIVIPSLEYDINKFHFFDQFTWKIKERGPAKVKIRITNAGAYGMTYLDLPFRNNTELTQLAMDIKDSIKLNRIRNVWSSPDGEIKEERKTRDGSYGVKGSGGFGPEETFYPRLYYEELAIAEAQWEFLLHLESLNEEMLEEKHNELKKQLDLNVKSWTSELNTVSKLIETEFQNHKSEKIQTRLHESPVDRHMHKYQRQMNVHFEQMTKNYSKLLEKLKRNQIHKHGEIVNLGDRVSSSYRDKLESDSRARRVINGISTTERIGMAKRLPEYLAEAKYSNFSFGEKFHNRFKF